MNTGKKSNNNKENPTRGRGLTRVCFVSFFCNGSPKTPDDVYTYNIHLCENRNGRTRKKKTVVAFNANIIITSSTTGPILKKKTRRRSNFAQRLYDIFFYVTPLHSGLRTNTSMVQETSCFCRISKKTVQLYITSRPDKRCFAHNEFRFSLLSSTGTHFT